MRTRARVTLPKAAIVFPYRWGHSGGETFKTYGNLTSAYLQCLYGNAYLLCAIHTVSYWISKCKMAFIHEEGEPSG